MRIASLNVRFDLESGELNLTYETSADDDEPDDTGGLWHPDFDPPSPNGDDPVL